MLVQVPWRVVWLISPNSLAWHVCDIGMWYNRCIRTQSMCSPGKQWEFTTYENQRIGKYSVLPFHVRNAWMCLETVSFRFVMLEIIYFDFFFERREVAVLRKVIFILEHARTVHFMKFWIGGCMHSKSMLQDPFSWSKDYSQWWVISKHRECIAVLKDSWHEWPHSISCLCTQTFISGLQYLHLY